MAKIDQEIKMQNPFRHRLPETRCAVTHKFNISGHEGYMTVGLYEDGTPGELFITMAKEGSTIGGLMDTIAKLTSLALQSGISVTVLAAKFKDQRFEPSGYTQNPEIKFASSLIDYIFRWLEIYFAPEQIALRMKTTRDTVCAGIVRRTVPAKQKVLDDA